MSLDVSADVEVLADLVRGAGVVVALTGAGISVPSGIPDFRSPGTGLWENVDPMAVAHIDVWRTDPQKFWHFYGDRFQTLDAKEPNAAHSALTAMQAAGHLDAIVTQNIDMLHRKAGSRDIIEVHGTIESSSCLSCRAQFALAEVRGRLERSSVGYPECDCGRALKPDVVLFGEMLPTIAIERAFALAAVADVLLCVGSSLEVHPVAQLPEITRQGGGHVAIVTQGPTPYDAAAAVKLSGDVEAELQSLVAALA